MKPRYFFAIALIIPLLAFAPAGERTGRAFAGFSATGDEADGSSFEKAIVIQETSETTGVAAEYKWLREHYPGYKMRSQSLCQHEGKPYDILKIKWKRKKMSVYFDISNFFGKF